MATSEVEICASALDKLGAGTLSSLDDDSKEARLCKRAYPRLRDELLRAHPWNFAITRIEVAPIAEKPIYEFDNQFLIPDDALRILSLDFNINPTTSEIPWSVEFNTTLGKKVILCNQSSLKIKYIRKVTDVSMFDPIFAEVLAWRIAADLAYPLVQSSALAQGVFQTYLIMIRDARSFDGQEGSLQAIEADDWFFSRF